MSYKSSDPINGVEFIMVNNTVTKCVISGHIVILEGAKSIGACAFADNDHITGVTIPEGIEEIQGIAFRACRSLRFANLPNTLKVIGYSVFEDCHHLENIMFPDGLTEIGQQSFCHCVQLRKIIIPASVTQIQYGAFYGCRSLETVDILGEDVTIGEVAFAKCPNLRAVNIWNAPNPEIGKGAFDDDPELMLRGYADGSLEQYARSYHIPFEGIRNRS